MGDLWVKKNLTIGEKVDMFVFVGPMSFSVLVYFNCNFGLILNFINE